MGGFIRVISMKRYLILWLTIVCSTVRGRKIHVMKAVVLNYFGAPELLHVERIQIPAISRDQMLIKVMAAGINPVDAYIRSGKYPRKPKLPTVLGREISGVVEEVKNSTESVFQVGQSVFCGIKSGGYAEFAVANISSCYPLGDKLSFAEGASIYLIYLAAYRALITKAGIKSDETILVHGDNAQISTAAVQVAKSIGAYVVACVGEKVTTELNKRKQADEILLRGETDLDVVLKKLNKTGFDVIFESSTNAKISCDRFYLHPTNGRLLVVGNRNISKGGLYGTNIISFSFNVYTQEEEVAASQFFWDGIKNEWISPIVGTTYKLDNACEAHHDIISQKSSQGKLIFILE